MTERKPLKFGVPYRSRTGVAAVKGRTNANGINRLQTELDYSCPMKRAARVLPTPEAALTKSTCLEAEMAAGHSTRLLDVSTPAHPNTFTLVDACDFEFLSQWKWGVNSEGYVIRVVTIAGKTHTRRMHRIIADAPDGVMVDHANRDKLDNRRSNLRYASTAENVRNRNPSANRKYKGVYKTARGSWEAKIRVEGRLIYLGSFPTDLHAALAYDMAAREHFGAFARPNFSDRAQGM